MKAILLTEFSTEARQGSKGLAARNREGRKAVKSWPRALLCLTLLSLPSFSATAQGISGSALNFNGLNQHVRIPDFFTNAPTTEVTVEFWQNVSALRAQSSFSQDDSQRGGFDARNVFNAHVPYGNHRIYWDFGNIRTEGRLWYIPPESILGTWQHFAFVASQRGNFMRIYRNGVLEAQKPNMTPLTGGKFDLNIGGETYIPVSFGGMLAEFRIWNVARSQTEIQAGMHQSLTLPQTHLMAYWRFDEGGGEVAHDASGHGRDGILVNRPQWIRADARNLRIEEGGQVIDALGSDGAGKPACTLHSLQPGLDGRMRLQCSGTPGQTYIVEASTNLLDWQAVGEANVQSDGSFQFEDAEAAKYPCRFYRVVIPEYP